VEKTSTVVNEISTASTAPSSVEPPASLIEPSQTQQEAETSAAEVQMTGTDGARILSFSAPPTTQSVTRNNEAANLPKQRVKVAEKRTRKRARMPGQKRQARPPSVTGYYWRKEGAGWDLRKAVYVEENGVRKRKQPYLAHLSKSAFQEMKRRHKGAALEKAIAQWIADHDR